MTLVEHSQWGRCVEPWRWRVEEKAAENVFTAWTAAVIELILKNLVP